MLKTIKHYDYEPMYYLTYKQNICYSEILVNDIPVDKNYTDLGKGSTVTINNYIFKSGTQKVTFRLYPAIKGSDFDYKILREETDMQIDISESDNVDRYKKGKEIASYLTPTVDGVNENGPIKIFAAAGKNYYEASFTFEAKVPYEFTSLEKSQDLRKWNQEKLEQKVVDFYKKQWRLINYKEIEEYFSFLELKEKETCQSAFDSRKELEENLSAYLEPFINPTFRLEPLENYQLKFYGDGKIVCLELTSTEAKMRGKSALWGKYKKDGSLRAKYRKYYLYIPEGKDELEILR
ncbi:hypothetical protein [Flavobacterium chungangensis]|uniref:Uncharacterized protein n=1 Tax=Flavobacterium chungangensis TaxID=2708132 RepID=A0ABV8ZBP8_9FLAO